MGSGPRKHGVVSPSLVAAIEAFFDLRDWKGLWLSGGTCLAEYYFGHRVSVDADLFTADEVLFREARDVLRRPDALESVGEMETVRVDLHSCQFLLRCRTGDLVKVDLIRDIPVALDRKVEVGSVWLDSLLDLAANKMGCLIQREDVKDYVDLYYLLPHLDLDAADAVDLGRRKEAGLDPVLLAQQLSWVRSQPRPDFLRTDVPWESIQHFHRSLREDVLRLVEPGRP